MAKHSPPRRDRLIREREHDPYRSRQKPREPLLCSGCGAVFRGGRWRWPDVPVSAPEGLCPACQRERDGYPAGFVTLDGEFVGTHREELLGLARNMEEREKSQHPLKRIIGVRDEEAAVVIETSDMQLARSIGDAVHAAYQGELDYHYEKEGSLLRVFWKR